MRVWMAVVVVAEVMGCESGAGGGSGGGSAAAGGSAVGGGSDATGGSGTGGGNQGTGGGSTTGGGSGGAAGTYGPFAFSLGTHNFSFENYTNTPGITNLTPVELRRMFGDGVCAGSLSGDTCELTPNAEQWMNRQNAAMNGGHCEGMAVLSALFTVGELRPQDFGASTVFGLTLPGNTRLQREIAYWWATQAVDPTRSAETRSPDNALTPSQVVDRIRTMVASGGQIYTFGLYKRDGSGGHANNPYAVEERGGKVYVKVYENNFPTATTLEFEIDPTANTWRYFSTTNPSEPGSLYEGDSSTRSLTITPLSARLGRQTCPVCGAVSDDGTVVRGSAVAYREVIVSGEGRVLITDGAGKRLGYDGSSFVREIDGGVAVPLRRGPSTWTNSQDPIYRLPLGQPLTVTLDGTTLTAPSESGVTLSSPGYAFSVEGVTVDPGQKDTITFSAGTERVSYRTTSTETPTVELAVTFDGADYLFEVSSAAETGGIEITLTLDAVAGKLKVQATSADGTAVYAIRVERRATTGTAVFKHTSNSIASAAAVLFDFRAWAGDGSPMAAATDATNDGTEDSTEMLADEP